MSTDLHRTDKNCLYSKLMKRFNCRNIMALSCDRLCMALSRKKYRSAQQIWTKCLWSWVYKPSDRAISCWSGRIVQQACVDLIFFRFFDWLWFPYCYTSHSNDRPHIPSRLPAWCCDWHMGIMPAEHKTVREWNPNRGDLNEREHKGVGLSLRYRSRSRGVASLLCRVSFRGGREGRGGGGAQ